MKDEDFSLAYAKLNKEQKQAVDTIDGPVMVVAGPGTGKTQVLSLRIANILTQTDTPASGILCLTFTRAGVIAMKDRLRRYIGTRAGEVQVTTFHSFANVLIEKYYDVLGFEKVPKLLDDKQAVFLMDELLEKNTWENLRPRGDSTKYFSSIKSLISLLKRERVTAEEFLYEIEKDITLLKENPDNISSRGPTKGKLKQTVLSDIARLQKTSEVVSFYKEYEKLKREKGFMDYDDVLEYAVLLVEQSEDAKADLQENYLYVHIDEHQDSSGVQNSFVRAVWGDVENPNIFVVGDDRQLIYGFSGANLSYFEEFKTAFGKAKIITLLENYRSTKTILELADSIQKSEMTEGSLRSNLEDDYLVSLNEYAYPRDEILSASIYFKDKIGQGIDTKEMAILVPKNRHVRSAVAILKSQGVPVKSTIEISLFEMPETDILRRVFSIICNPFDREVVAKSLFDITSGIDPLNAHRFLNSINIYKLSLDDLLDTSFEDVRVWGERLSNWMKILNELSLDVFVQRVSNEILIDTSLEHNTLLRRVEVVRTFIEIVNTFLENDPRYTLNDLMNYISRLEQYGQSIGVAVIDGTSGVEVMTLHRSKGLEFEHVWIAHLNEGSLMNSKREDFALPESIQAKKELRNEAVVRREVYVAITRAKKYCTLSYATLSATGRDDELAKVISDIPTEFFDKKVLADTQNALLEYSPTIFVEENLPADKDKIDELVQFVKETYSRGSTSVTMLNNFFKCPWTWYFRNLVRLPEEKTESLFFGTAVHGVLESIINKNINTDIKDIEEKMISILHKDGVIDEHKIKRVLKDGLPIISAWIQNHLPNLSENRSTERPFSYNDPEFSHLNLHGKIDLVEEKDDSMVVTDFKTGSPKTHSALSKKDEEGRLSDYERQLAMYTYLLQGNGKKNITSKLFFLEASEGDKNKIYAKDIDSETVELLRKDIKDYDSLVQNGEWINRPCKNEGYGNTECIYCKMAKRLYGI